MGDKQRPGPTTRITAGEVRGGRLQRKPDTLVTEEPLEIRIEWPGHPPVSAAVAMRTPGADFELAAGFLLSDGVIGVGTRPRTVAYCLEPSLQVDQLYNVVTVSLAEPPLRHPTPRTTAVSSACGVCGAQSLVAVFTPQDDPIPVEGRVDATVIPTLPDRLLTRQSLFGRTGAIHAAGVFGMDGEVLLVREDVGRHNAVDKVLGARVLGSATFGHDVILCVSGRVGFD
ncbi:MAG: formate dehydrogenase accessory sulfurtransferase FdhD, partial [Sciscionella sp.]